MLDASRGRRGPGPQRGQDWNKKEIQQPVTFPKVSLLHLCWELLEAVACDIPLVCPFQWCQNLATIFVLSVLSVLRSRSLMCYRHACTIAVGPRGQQMHRVEQKRSYKFFLKECLKHGIHGTAMDGSAHWSIFGLDQSLVDPWPFDPWPY